MPYAMHNSLITLNSSTNILCVRISMLLSFVCKKKKYILESNFYKECDFQVTVLLWKSITESGIQVMLLTIIN